MSRPMRTVSADVLDGMARRINALEAEVERYAADLTAALDTISTYAVQNVELKAEAERLRGLTYTARACSGCGRSWYPVEDEEVCPYCEVVRLRVLLDHGCWMSQKWEESEAEVKRLRAQLDAAREMCASVIAENDLLLYGPTTSWPSARSSVCAGRGRAPSLTSGPPSP